MLFSCTCLAKKALKALPVILSSFIQQTLFSSYKRSVSGTFPQGNSNRKALFFMTSA